MSTKVIISVLLTIIIIAGITTGVILTVTFLPKSEIKNKRKMVKKTRRYKDKEQNNQDQNLKTYQDLKELKNKFETSFNEANNFKNPSVLFFKISQKAFIDTYQPKLNNFQQEFSIVNPNNKEQINNL